MLFHLVYVQSAQELVKNIMVAHARSELLPVHRLTGSMFHSTLHLTVRVHGPLTLHSAPASLKESSSVARLWPGAAP